MIRITPEIAVNLRGLVRSSAARRDCERACCRSAQFDVFAFTEQDQLAAQRLIDKRIVLFFALRFNADRNRTGETGKTCYAGKDGRADDLVTARTDVWQFTLHRLLHTGEGFRAGKTSARILEALPASGGIRHEGHE